MGLSIVRTLSPASLNMLTSSIKVLISLFIIGATALDLVADYRGGLSLMHFIVEIAIVGVILALAHFGWLIAGLTPAAHASALSPDFKFAAPITEAAKPNTVSSADPRIIQFSQRIDQWRLSPAESEVAFLLLLGRALREIAEHRGTSERTTRQQAQEVYRKAGVDGRAELAALLLKELLEQDPCFERYLAKSVTSNAKLSA